MSYVKLTRKDYYKMSTRRNLIVIKRFAKFSQPCLRINNTVQVHKIKVPYMAKQNISADSQQVQFTYRRDLLLNILSKVSADKQFQRLSPKTCLEIQRLGLCRRGKRGGVRFHLHLNMDKPTGSNPANIRFIMQKENITKYQPEKQFTLLLLNSQSLKPKEIMVHHLESEKVDALVITETWLSDKDADKVWISSSDLNKNGLKLLTSNRKSKQGGGLALVTKTKYKPKQVSQKELNTFQVAEWNLSVSHNYINVFGIYRPPQGSPLEFLDEFTEWVSDVMSNKLNVILAGDFNLHMNNPNDDNAANLIDCMTALGMSQQVHFTTHKSGNTLDLIFIEDFSDLHIKSCIQGNFISDHCVITCRTSLSKHDIVCKQVSYQDLKSIDIEEMWSHYDFRLPDGNITIDEMANKLN